MHQPPAWVLEGSESLSLEGFQTAFAMAWGRLEQRFIKVECWQSYREAEGVRSQDAFQRGDVALARRLLMDEARADQPLYDEVAARKLDFSRIRLIAYPLSDYLRYELINYDIRSRLGERIELILPVTPVENYFDFLLFDSRTALIHDYGAGPAGHQVGGWVSHHPEVLDGLASIATELRTHGRHEQNPAPGSDAYRK